MASGPVFISAGAFTLLILYYLIVELVNPMKDVGTIRVNFVQKIPTFGLQPIFVWLIWILLLMVFVLLNITCLASDMEWCSYVAYFFSLAVLGLVFYAIVTNIYDMIQVDTNVMQENKN